MRRLMWIRFRPFSGSSIILQISLEAILGNYFSRNFEIVNFNVEKYTSF